MKKMAILAALMVVGAGVALATTLEVPFFLDTSTDNSTKIAGFIGVKESSGSPQTITVIYTALGSSGTPTSQTITFALGANGSVAWAPVQNNPAEPAPSAAITNMSIFTDTANTIKQTAGSAKIIGTGRITGDYHQIQFNRSSDWAYTLPANPAQ